jgi:alpha-tubulin suppressor-like RCC1 family protein
MRALRSAAPLAAAALGLALGAACGDTLVDHRNTAVRDAGNGGNPVCDDVTTVACFDPGLSKDVCTKEDATHCGTTCEDCTTGQIPAGGQAFCDIPTGGHGSCTYECTGGLLRCATGCCAASTLAAGDGHTCAILSDGGVACWGDNGAGQVDEAAPRAAQLTPARPFTTGVTRIAAGEAHTCAVVSGAVHCWGDDGAGQAPPTVAGVTGATALAAGASHTCALVANGAVKCWGLAARLGGTATSGIATPIASGATAIAAGRDHTCALLSTGAVSCWGLNTGGQLGNGGAASSLPVTPTGLGAGTVAAIDAGPNVTCAAIVSPTVDQAGVLDAVKCWGSPPGWTLFGFAAPQPTPAVPLKDSNTATVRASPIVKVGAGRAHACVARAAESPKCFGADNAKGQLGGTPPGATETVDTGLVAPGADFFVGADHACTIAASGVHCWGDNALGQLGDGTQASPATGSSTTVSGR